MWVCLLFEGTLFLVVLQEHQKQHHPFCWSPPPPPEKETLCGFRMDTSKAQNIWERSTSTFQKWDGHGSINPLKFMRKKWC